VKAKPSAIRDSCWGFLALVGRAFEGLEMSRAAASHADVPDMGKAVTLSTAISDFPVTRSPSRLSMAAAMQEPLHVRQLLWLAIGFIAVLVAAWLAPDLALLLTR
jgi:hypothetical protein